MSEWGVFGVVGTLLAFVGTSYSMFYKPTHDLKVELVRLNVNIEAMSDSIKVHDHRLANHSDRIDINERDIRDLKHAIEAANVRIDNFHK